MLNVLEVMLNNWAQKGKPLPRSN